MNSLARRTLSTAAVVASVAGAGLGLAPSAQAATSPFLAATSARVPAGWTAVETDTTGVITSGSLAGSVYAISPTGAQTQLLRIPANEQVQAVSGDGRRIATQAMGPATNEFKVYDLATHRVTSLPQHGGGIMFTRPTGTNLYVLPTGVGAGQMVRTDLAGHVLAHFPGITDQDAVATPNGTLVWGLSHDHVTLNDNATGRQLRGFANPRGFDRCSPTRTWDATSVVGSCSPAGGAASGAQVFLFHTNGTTTPLTGPLAAQLPKAPGYMDAWKSSAGLVAQQEVLCGWAPAVLQAGRGGRDIPIDQVTDVMGTRAFGVTPVTCDSPTRAFVSADLPSMKVHRLLTPAAGRSVTAVVTNDPTQGVALVV